MFSFISVKITAFNQIFHLLITIHSIQFSCSFVFLQLYVLRVFFSFSSDLPVFLLILFSFSSDLLCVCGKICIFGTAERLVFVALWRIWLPVSGFRDFGGFTEKCEESSLVLEPVALSFGWVR